MSKTILKGSSNSHSNGMIVISNEAPDVSGVSNWDDYGIEVTPKEEYDASINITVSVETKNFQISSSKEELGWINTDKKKDSNRVGLDQLDEFLFALNKVASILKKQ